MVEFPGGQPPSRDRAERDAERKRRRLFRTGMLLHVAVLGWWPFSVQIAAREPGLFPETIHAYLLASALVYPVFVGAAFYFARRGVRSPSLKPLLPIGLALPLLSGTWWMIAALIVSVLIGR